MVTEWLVGYLQGPKRAAENGLNLDETLEKHSAGDKALLILWVLLARLKSCPDASGLFIKYSRNLWIPCLKAP
jgi:hypothetical protein